MTNFLVPTKGGVEHYFYKPYEGICLQIQSPGGSFSEHQQVISAGRDIFCVYADSDGIAHLICTDAENHLIYAVRKNNTWKKYILSTLSKDIFISDIRIYSINDRLNFLYSALYNGETLLVHCILGDHARPSTVSSLETSHFYIWDKKAYFTNVSGVLGYVSLSDEKPSFFYPVCEDAHFCTLSSLCGKDMMIFTRSSRLFINGVEILYDSRMETPIFVRGADRSYIMWKSGSFIRYIATFNGGATWSEPMRFMSTGSTPSMFIAQLGEMYNMYYGYQSQNKITLLGAPDVFETTISSYREIDDLKKQLSRSKAETASAKREIERLNKIISGIIK